MDHSKVNTQNDSFRRAIFLLVKQSFVKMRSDNFLMLIALLIVYFWLNLLCNLLGISIFRITMGVGAVILLISFPLFVAFFALLGMPKSFFKVQYQLVRSGLINSAGEVPLYLSRTDTGLHFFMLYFYSNGIGIAEWEKRRLELESALNIYIDRIQEGKSKHYIKVYASSHGLPERIEWSDDYLPLDSSELLLGMGIFSPISVNLNRMPHILIGGSTGCGKSFLQKNLIEQCVLHCAEVNIIDVKGGLDYYSFRDSCKIYVELRDILECLRSVLQSLQERRTECARIGVANMKEYNGHYKRAQEYRRIVIVIDELAELLAKGNTKESKAIASEIEDILSTIARLGRAFHINLILATQRPDATIINGQIRNNCDTRICGRCSQNLALVIHDDARAAELIPGDSQGVFLTQDGVLFKGFAPPKEIYYEICEE